MRKINHRKSHFCKAQNQNRFSVLRIALIAGLLACSLLAHQDSPAQCPIHVYLGNAPDRASNWDWLEGMQGIAHYEGGWYFTTLGWLRKVPHSANLDSRGPVVQEVGMPASLRQLGYDHFGDLDAFGGFLFVPVDRAGAAGIGTTALAVFREANLEFVGYKSLREGRENVRGGGWVAVDPITGILYTSDSRIGTGDNAILYRYSINLEMLRRPTPVVANSITLLPARFVLREVDGSPLREGFAWMQGGVFSPLGDLFLSNGGAYVEDNEIRGGVHVFDRNGRMIKEFVLDNYNPGFSSQGAEFEESEGLDWKDLGPSGQLHVLVVDHDRLSCNSNPPDHEGDDLYFKHYNISYTTCFHTAPGVGNEGQGAEIAITNLDGNPRPEMILMAYDSPEGPNTFRYKIGFNLNNGGVPSVWSAFSMVPGVGNEGQGAGIAITNLDGNPRPEMILMAYDNPTGPNTFRYKIGFNLDNAGTTSVWSAFTMVPGVGNYGQGAGIAITNLDGNPRPEMILMAYDNPTGPNNFRYKIGFNLNNAGTTSVWSAFSMVPGIGNEGQGAGIAITNLDGNPRPDMILMAYDNPEGLNNFHYKIGFNLNDAGTPSVWSAFTMVPGVGYYGQGAGVAITNLDGNPRPEMILMAYDNPEGPNTFRYKVGLNLNLTGTASWNWIPYRGTLP